MKRKQPEPNRTIRHTFRLTEKENTALLAEVSRCGYRENLSKYIVKKLFSGDGNVDPAPQINLQYLKKLCDFYYQFQKIGNNYNQVVRAINSQGVGEETDKLLKILIAYTRQLKGLSEQIITLTEQLKQRWLP